MVGGNEGTSTGRMGDKMAPGRENRRAEDKAEEILSGKIPACTSVDIR
jgi:hypothetical protein